MRQRLAPEWLRVRDAADYSGISQTELFRLCVGGEIQSVHKLKPCQVSIQNKVDWPSVLRPDYQARLCCLQYLVNSALVALADLITSPAWALAASIVTASVAIVIRFFVAEDTLLRRNLRKSTRSSCAEVSTKI